MGNINTGTPLVTPREMNGQMINLIVNSIVEDLSNCSGLEDIWDCLDKKNQDEITEEWCEIINSCWLRGHPG